MDEATRPLTIGFPRMHREAGERRDFLPSFVRALADLGAEVVVESGIGSGMGATDHDYTGIAQAVRAGTEEDAYRQDVVMILRCPDEEKLGWMRPGATLISMLHYPTRPKRVARLRELGLEAISMDSIADDQGRRLVEDARSVAWNGLEAAFEALGATFPRFTDPGRPPLRALVLGIGAIGKHAVEAATKYGNLERNEAMTLAGCRGVEVTVVGRNVTAHDDAMLELLSGTDVLVDAAQRHDAARSLVPNGWIGRLPEHAVICDLVVDPYLLDEVPPTVRGIEGIPQGDLDGYVFPPDHPAWETTVPAGVPNGQRRTVVSCYSWPGVHPEPCMETYGLQLAPLMEALLERGGVEGLRPDGPYHERALHRASLRHWSPA